MKPKYFFLLFLLFSFTYAQEDSTRSKEAGNFELFLCYGLLFPQENIANYTGKFELAHGYGLGFLWDITSAVSVEGYLTGCAFVKETSKLYSENNLTGMVNYIGFRVYPQKPELKWYLGLGIAFNSFWQTLKPAPDRGTGTGMDGYQTLVIPAGYTLETFDNLYLDFSFRSSVYLPDWKIDKVFFNLGLFYDF